MPVKIEIDYYTICDVQTDGCELTGKQICVLAEELWSSNCSNWDENSLFTWKQKTDLVSIYEQSRNWR